MSGFESTQVMRFTPNGIAAVRLAIEGLRDEASTKKGSQGTPILSDQLESLAQLALRQDLVEAFASNLTIDTTREFANRYEMGRYLASIVTSAQAEKDTGLWTWISMVYLSQLLAPRKDGTFLLGSEYRYIPDDSRLRYYRHLARMAWTIFRQYGEKSKLFLSIPCSTHSDFVEQSQKDDVRSNSHLIDLCLDIFYDEKQARLRKGVAGDVKTPGTFRRLVSVISPQLYMNFDLYEMPAERIRSVLPREFEKWFKLAV
ncbi:MAG: hypothetical protein CL574_05740 [Altererythrobacter sp.]|nr:hypothetical protein [Altererythrobacter sp.]|tara:strand:- start:9775 stop:10548 length:774 start_codon:yes stop_codon:yes gene_type:complete